MERCRRQELWLTRRAPDQVLHVLQLRRGRRGVAVALEIGVKQR